MSKEKQFEQFGRLAYDLLKDALVNSAPDIDGEQLADLAVDAGLMELVPYDVDKHGEFLSDCEYYDEGMMIYWEVD